MIIAAAVALTLTGCSSSGAPAGMPPSLEHVHGIAADPRGTDLFVATHNGIFTVTPAGEVSGPIGGHDFDAMGFTVSDETLYASGHPGSQTPVELGEPNLGLIRSEDYGQSWSPMSLTGTTDFHLLTAGPDGVLYGIASSQVDLLISTDGGREWTRGASLEAVDLVATDVGVYAAAEEGLLLSVDQGATFSRVEVAPTLYTLDARSDGSLVGVDTDGNVWTQNASGTWESTERVEGAAQAFSAVDDDRIILVDERGVVEITSEGSTVLSPAR